MPRTFTDQSGTQHIFEDGTPDSVVSKVLGVGPDSLRKLATADSNKVTVRAHVREMPKFGGGTSGGKGGGASFAPEPQTAADALGQKLGMTPQVQAQMKPQVTGPAAELVGGALGGLMAPEAELPALARAIMAMGGGMTGKFVSQPNAPMQDIAAAGARQGGYQLGGEGAGKVIGAVGKTAGTAAYRFLPEVAQTAINEGITSTRAGFQKAMSKLGEYGTRTLKMLAVPTRAGVRFEPGEFLNGAVQGLGRDLQSTLPGAAEDADTYGRLSQEWLQNPNNKGPLTPLSLQRIKQDAQDAAKPLFERMARKEQVSATESASAKWYKAIADHAKQQLEAVTPDMVDTATGRVISLAESNAQTQAVKAVADQIRPIKNQAMRIAGSPLGRAAIGAGVGSEVPGNRPQHALEGALFGTATTPQALSSLALAAQNPLIAQAIANIGRAGGFVLGQ